MTALKNNKSSGNDNIAVEMIKYREEGFIC